jgi:hypothetical protein
MAVGAVGLAAAILLPERLPFVDFPQHVALLARWTHAGDPAWGVPVRFEVQLGTPYVLGYAAAYLLAPAFGDELALRVVMLAGILGLPAATYLVLRVYYRPSELCLAAVPVGLSWVVYMGFFPFVVALPFALIGIALARRVTVTGRRREAVALAVVCVVALAAHAVAFLIAAGGVVLIAVEGAARSRRSWPAIAATLLALLPASLLALAWLVLRGAAVNPEPRPVLFGPPARRLDIIASVFGSGNADPRVVLVAATFALIMLGAAVLAYLEGRDIDLRARATAWLESRRGSLVPFAGAAIACGLVPLTAFDAYGLWQRVAPVAFVLGLVLLPWPTRPSSRRAMGLGLAAVGLFATSTALWQGLAYSDSAAGLREVIAALPPGRRLYSEAPLDAAAGTAGLQVRAFRHMGAYYVAERGGTLNYDFGYFPFQVIVAVIPGSFREPMSAFDLYLFRASPSCPAPPADRPVGRELASAGGWHAYEVAHDPGRPGPTAYDLPCAGPASPGDQDTGP